MGRLKLALTKCILLILCVSFLIMLINVLHSVHTKKSEALPNTNEVPLYPDHLSLLDLAHFSYIINNNVCDEHDPITAILIVTSYAGNIQGRNKIRHAYPESELRKLGIKRVFLLAILKHNKTEDVENTASVTQNDVLVENDRFSDIVQGNFIEAYRNLTYKHMMGLQWAVNYCKETRFIIKMDDDIVVDFYQLMDLLKSIKNMDRNNFLMGYILRGLNAIREKTNKWFVTFTEYREAIYPPFVSGWLYITTPTTAESLINTSKTTPFFWIDDTFVTGILAKQNRIRHQDISEKFTANPEYLECCFNENDDSKLTCDFIVGPNGGDTGLLQRFQRHAAYCHSHNCPKRSPERSLKKTCVTKEKPVNLGRGKAEILPFNLF